MSALSLLVFLCRKQADLPPFLSFSLISILAPPRPHSPTSSHPHTAEESSSPTLHNTSISAEVPVSGHSDDEDSKNTSVGKFRGSKGGALEEAQHARDLLSQLSAVCVGCSTELLTLNALADDLTKRGHSADGNLPPVWLAAKILVSHSTGLLVRAPYLVPLFALHAVPYAVATYCSTKYASHEEESMASAKALV